MLNQYTGAETGYPAPMHNPPGYEHIPVPVFDNDGMYIKGNLLLTCGFSLVFIGVLAFFGIELFYPEYGIGLFH